MTRLGLHRRSALALAVAMATVLVLTTYVVARSASVLVPTESITSFGAIIRRDTTGPWGYVDGGLESAHRRAGFTTLTCDSRTGILHARFLFNVEGGLQNVVFAGASHDEAMARRGIIAGASVAGGDMRILFTRITGTGPHPLSCTSSYLRGSNANFWIALLGEPWS